MALIHLIYTSFATGQPSQADLEELLTQSRARNERQHVTGMLLFRSNMYLQVLEGDEQDVKEIYADIVKDPRNFKVTKLLEEGIIKRDFEDWTMGFKRLDEDTAAVEGWSGIINGDYDQQHLYKSRNLAVNLILSFSSNI